MPSGNRWCDCQQRVVARFPFYLEETRRAAQRNSQGASTSKAWGCSVGGSCAIDGAVAAPEQVATLVLIGTKADLRPQPDLRAAALQMLREHGVEKAWETYWAPLFSPSADPRIVAEARRIALSQAPEAIACGVTAFHTRPSRGSFLSTVRCPVICRHRRR